MNSDEIILVPEEKIDEIIEIHNNRPGALLLTLEEIQELHPFKYLPDTTLSFISKKLNVPYSQVYSVATFYSFFNLKPQGKHTIIVCRGTACHTKGSKMLLDETCQSFGIKPGDYEGEPSFTTPNKMFTVKTVACFGQCALSPVVSIDGVIYSNINSQKLLKIIDIVKHKN
jgi:NADH-quinone oxidoreductase subunit E